ncbi:catalase [Mucilaginibacter polytrichastri]|uniref:catalase n=1 Tax=Mucilaginibacter polytrichastri TaxID=1302689 RepID=A0A1Q5ZY43_9SPHI|nr:catalase [Mucilaginibacter polytrichastri]OKS86694.1 Catalase [Mucilaginibacter polytrichastri]SFS82267.1 catalase [Mucilaginibacter polytrichastri]
MEKKLTTAAGIPYAHHEDSQSVGQRGPLLLQDFILHEKLAHFTRERIPERVVHAKGSGAYGSLTITNDISAYTRAKVFNAIGKTTKLFIRFSLVAGEKGSSETERDPRGFAMKFYTEDGNWDLVGNNTPIFFIKDGKKFPDFIHSEKRDPYTNLKSPTMAWDFFSLNPESLHQVMFLMSDRGTPYGYRHMHGFGSHTFSLINAKNERTWVKFHFKTQQGIKNFTDAEAALEKSVDLDFAQRDLLTAIDRGEFPKWDMKIQVMTEAQAETYAFNPFDLTKTWSHKEFPLIDVGVVELNENPKNYHAAVEQSAFAPAHVVDGIGYSPDRVLQARILSYPDAQRYRLGVNYEDIPVNRCPYMVNNYQRDGLMVTGDNGGSEPNYFPNSFDNIQPDPAYTEPALQLNSNVVDTFDRNAPGENDHYTQPGIFFRETLSDELRLSLVANVVKAMKGIEGPKKMEIINRQLCHFFRADIGLGMQVARGLEVDVSLFTQPH